MRRGALPAILLLALALRLLGIDAPLRGEQAVRQQHTAEIARHFHERGYAFAYPQIDWGGEGPGYVESELPLFPFLVALGYAVFGANPAVGRALAALFSLLGIVFLHRLVRGACDEPTALWSAFWLAVLPTHVFFGRAFMPESLLLMASTAGLAFFADWVGRGRRTDFALAAAFTSLACLVKPYALVLGAPLLWLAWQRDGRRLWRRAWPWGFAALVLVPVAIWYAHARTLYWETGLTFGIWGYGSDKWGNWALVATGDYWKVIVFDRLAKTHLTWAGFALFVAALALPRRSAVERVFDAWLVGLLVFLVVVGVGNLEHSYYQLAGVPPAAAFLGKLYARHFRPGDAAGASRASTVALGAALLTLLLLSADRWSGLRERERAATPASSHRTSAPRAPDAPGTVGVPLPPGLPRSAA